MGLYYATLANIRDRFPSEADFASITNDEGAGVADEAYATAQGEGAESIIHSYVGARYGAPINITNVVTAMWAREITLDLWEVKLLRNCNRVSEAKERNWDARIAELEMIRDGRIPIPGIDDTTVVDPTPGVSFGVQDADEDYRVHTRSTHSGW